MKTRNPVGLLVEALGDRMRAANDVLSKARRRDSYLAFLAENDDAIIAPFVILSIHMDRQEISRLSAGSPAERKRAAALRRKLLEEFTAYATPKPLRRVKRSPAAAPLSPEAKRLQAEIRLNKLAQARALAELAFLRRGEKKAVAFARFAERLGAVAPESGAALPSRAAQRAEQRARKKAGEAPRPRGRPARPR